MKQWTVAAAAMVVALALAAPGSSGAALAGELGLWQRHSALKFHAFPGETRLHRHWPDRFAHRRGPVVHPDGDCHDPHPDRDWRDQFAGRHGRDHFADRHLPDHFERPDPHSIFSFFLIEKLFGFEPRFAPQRHHHHHHHHHLHQD